jgi:hypothetical protein
MKNTEPYPPRWAQAVLQCVLRPSDRESIAGDLLEEYRVAREPALGRLRADVWYVEQVLSIVWRPIWPSALAFAVQSVFLALTVFRPGHHAPHQAPLPTFVAAAFDFFWYGSVAPAPGVSIVDAAIYFVAACCGARRTGLVRTGMLVAAVTSCSVRPFSSPRRRSLRQTLQWRCSHSRPSC